MIDSCISSIRNGASWCKNQFTVEPLRTAAISAASLAAISYPNAYHLMVTGSLCCLAGAKEMKKRRPIQATLTIFAGLGAIASAVYYSIPVESSLMEERHSTEFTARQTIATNPLCRGDLFWNSVQGAEAINAHKSQLIEETNQCEEWQDFFNTQKNATAEQLATDLPNNSGGWTLIGQGASKLVAKHEKLPGYVVKFGSFLYTQLRLTRCLEEVMKKCAQNEFAHIELPSYNLGQIGQNITVLISPLYTFASERPSPSLINEVNAFVAWSRVEDVSSTENVGYTENRAVLYDLDGTAVRNHPCDF